MSEAARKSATPATKYCNGCKQTKPLSAFAKNRCAKDGLQFRCRPCQGELVRNAPKQIAARALAEEHRQERAALQAAGMKRCSTCKQTKAVAAFGGNRANKDGLSAICRGCAASRRCGLTSAEVGASVHLAAPTSKPVGVAPRALASVQRSIPKPAPAAGDSGVLASGMLSPALPSVTEDLRTLAHPAGAQVLFVCDRTDPLGICACGKRKRTRCGFPNQGSTCGKAVCPDCGHRIREGLVYCGPHWERSQAALADLARRKGQ